VSVGASRTLIQIKSPTVAPSARRRRDCYRLQSHRALPDTV